MKNALKEIITGFYSLVTGMRITLGQFFKPTVTVRYPHETLKMPPRFRGHIELVSDPATGKPLCFVCKLCEKACPSDCITVEGIKPEGARRKTVTQYRLDFTKCSLCGSCVEACRDGAIRFSREYNLASTRKEDYVMDLFKRLEAASGKEEGRTQNAEVGNQVSEGRGQKAEVTGQGTAPVAQSTPLAPRPSTLPPAPSTLDPQPSPLSKVEAK